MARRWTPKRFVTLRRVRVMTCVAALTLTSALAFGIGARKSVALTVNGETKTVTTYAMSVDRLLQEQGVKIKTHDLVESTSPTSMLKNHDVVTVQSAYQTTITINGQEVPFWTVASSAEQLLDFFNQNETEAAKITVNINNVYNKLTGGLVINQKGPVTVIADGKSSVAPNGKLPAASILDSKGITLSKEDRVNVEKDGGKTILRVRRVTHGEETRTKEVPFDTQTIVDPSLQPGEVTVRQEGENGEIQQTYAVTYVDGVKESETLSDEKTTKIAIDKVIAVGPAKSSSSDDSSDSDDSDNSNNANGSGKTDDSSDSDTKNDSNAKGDSGKTDSSNKNNGSSDKSDSGNKNDTGKTDTDKNNGNGSGNSQTNTDKNDSGKTDAGNGNGSNTSGSGNTKKDDSTPTPAPTPTPTPTPTPQPSDPSAGCRLYHPSAAQAQAYAAGAAAQRGWTGQNWTDLVKLWNRESGWQWYAENAYSGAYGIPQSMPGSKMAAFGARWKDDGAVQIDWGLSYIAQRYGTPSNAWKHSEETGWY